MAENLNVTRQTLLQRLKDPADQFAWSEFQDFYWQLIIGWAKMYGCSDNLAKDVFQETMINLLKNMPDFQYDAKKGCFRSYLKTIVSRRVKDAYRRESRYVTEQRRREDEQDLVGRMVELPDGSPEQESELDLVWLRNVMAQAMRQACHSVTPLTYKSFCLFVLDGFPVEEVAARIGIDRERTVYEHKRRFLEIMQREFQTLLKELDDIESVGSTLPSEASLFTKALEDYLRNHRDCRDTVLEGVPGQALLKQIEFVAQAMQHVVLPAGEGAYLIDCTGLIHNQPAVRLTGVIEQLQWIKLEETLTFGRNESCDLTLDGKKVSGLHGRLQKDSKGWLLKDENSTNGLFLNGKRIKNEQLLKNGDIIQVSDDHQFIFYENVTG